MKHFKEEVYTLLHTLFEKMVKNTSQLILWGLHNPDTKPGQILQEQISTKFSHENRHNNPYKTPPNGI